jgi:predicted AlkP superfamily phosphohydrolase/phosphomutase
MQPPEGEPLPGRRVVVLGFDGASDHLLRRFVAEGRMPAFAELESRGTRRPLGSSNPAESPVAWASLNSGRNPGSTNILGFVRRYLADPRTGSPYASPRPDLGYQQLHQVPLERALAPTEQGGAGGEAEEDVIAAPNPDDPGGEKSPAWTLGTSIAVGLLAWWLLRRMGSAGPGWMAIFGAFLAALIAAWAASAAPKPPSDSLTMPVLQNDFAGDNFWDHLDRAGLRSRVLQAACCFPAQAGPNTRLLAGLAVPDVGGSPGSFFLFTNSDFEMSRPSASGGKVVRFALEDQGLFQTQLSGPAEFVVEQQLRRRLQELDDQLQELVDGDERDQLQRKRNAAQFEFQSWRLEAPQVSLPVQGEVDRVGGRIRFQVGEHDTWVAEGQWSDYLPVCFPIEGAFEVNGLVRFHVSECRPESQEVRFYVPAISVAADRQPPHMAVTSPASFGRDLVQAAGAFDTVGWSCQTHALKDREIEEASFLSEIWHTVQWRRRMLRAQFGAASKWQLLFQVFGELDRVCHMLYHHFDPLHPAHDPEAAQRRVRFAAREIELKDAIPAIYEQMDRTLGMVLQAVDQGELGDCTVLVVSDHGFQPFREQVELNALLIELGFLHLREEFGLPTMEDQELGYVDWSRTRAYALGLGGIYLNLEGREPRGIVAADDYDSLCQEIIAALRSYRNPREDSPNPEQVVADAWLRKDLFAGPYAADQWVQEGVCMSGAPDIQVGFQAGYRIAWATTTGDRSLQGVVYDNDSPWGGDHVSVHPALVHGIFLCNRTMEGSRIPHLQDIAPTVLRLLGVAVPGSMEGHALPLEGLREAVRTEPQGGVNRQSLSAP